MACLPCFFLEGKIDEDTARIGIEDSNGAKERDIIRRISTLHIDPPKEMVGPPSTHRVSTQFSKARRVSTMRRYSRTGSRIAIGLSSLMESEKKRNLKENAQYEDVTYKDIQEAQANLQKRLRYMNLKQVIMGDDGNCQFRALSWQLYGNQNQHGRVREEVVKWIQEHAANFKFFFENEREFENYLFQMRLNRTWGDELTVRAACDRYRKRIHIITTEKQNWYLQYLPEGIDGKPEGHVFLTYISPIHYNTIQEV